jgi:hypothetical protein
MISFLRKFRIVALNDACIQAINICRHPYRQYLCILQTVPVYGLETVEAACQKAQ